VKYFFFLKTIGQIYLTLIQSLFLKIALMNKYSKNNMDSQNGSPSTVFNDIQSSGLTKNCYSAVSTTVDDGNGSLKNKPCNEANLLVTLYRRNFVIFLVFFFCIAILSLVLSFLTVGF
jgi:hypothetical protein